PSATAAEAVANAGASGTRSVLDVGSVTPAPEPGGAGPVPAGVLLRVFGTERPTRAAVEQGYDEDEAFEDYFAGLEGRAACCVVVHEGGEPREVFLAGWTYD